MVSKVNIILLKRSLKILFSNAYLYLKMCQWTWKALLKKRKQAFDSEHRLSCKECERISATQKSQWAKAVFNSANNENHSPCSVYSKNKLGIGKLRKL